MLVTRACLILTVCLAPILVFIGPPAAFGQGNGAAIDKARLKGAWRLIYEERNGIRTKVEDGSTLIFKGNRWLQKKNGETIFRGSFVLNVRSNPRRMTFLTEKKGGKPTATATAYRVTPNTFTYAYNKNGVPKSLATRRGSATVVSIWQRVKLAKPTVATETARLKGVWKHTYVERNGRRSKVNEDLVMIFNGNSWIEKKNGKVIFRGSFVLNVRSNPGKLTFLTDRKGATPIVTPTIYEVDGDVFMYAFGKKGLPSSFTTRSGDGALVSIWRRVKGSQRGVIHQSGFLTAKDRFDSVRRTSYHKVHTAKLAAGKSYTINLNSGKFDSFLRLESPLGRQLAFNDDGGDGSNARIVFRPKRSGTYRIIVTSYYSRQTGPYTLEIVPSK